MPSASWASSMGIGTPIPGSRAQRHNEDGGTEPPDDEDDEMSADCLYLSPPVAGDPKSCHGPLTPTDFDSMASSRQHIRAPDEFTDVIAQEECRQIVQQMDSLLVAGKIFRGKSNTPVPAHHHGETFLLGPRLFAHIEPRVLDAGGVHLLWALMPESLHLEGREHDGQVSEPYQADYFNRVRIDRGPNTCIK